MFGRLKQMLIKEFIQVFRDKRTRFILFVPPIIQMLIFGYAATFDIHHVPTVVLDLDHSQESRELISRFTSSPYFDVQRQLTDSRQIRDLIDRGQATVGLEIDAGFAAEAAQGRDRAAASDCGCDQLEHGPDRIELHFADRARLCARLSAGPHLPDCAAVGGSRFHRSSSNSGRGITRD
jgi:hypothetical protein